MHFNDRGYKIINLGKEYRVWNHPRDMLLEALSIGKRHRVFRALYDISFEIRRGSVVGIIGRNGAGKSTLLGIVAPRGRRLAWPW